MRDLVYLDTETTGLRSPYIPAGRRIWEVAAIRITPGATSEADTVVYRPVWAVITDVDLTDADPYALQIGGYWTRGHCTPGDSPQPPDGADARCLYQTEREVMARLVNITADARIIGSKPTFDMDGIEEACRRHGMLPRWYHHPQDIQSLAAGWLRGRGQTVDPDVESNTSQLSYACGVDLPAQMHTAMGDAEWAWRWDRKLRGVAS